MIAILSIYSNSVRSRQNEEDDEHDDDGHGYENGGYGPNGDSWFVHVGGQSVNRVQDCASLIRNNGAEEVVGAEAERWQQQRRMV